MHSDDINKAIETIRMYIKDPETFDDLQKSEQVLEVLEELKQIDEFMPVSGLHLNSISPTVGYAELAKVALAYLDDNLSTLDARTLGYMRDKAKSLKQRAHDLGPRITYLMKELKRAEKRT